MSWVPGISSAVRVRCAKTDTKASSTKSAFTSHSVRQNTADIHERQALPHQVSHPVRFGQPISIRQLASIRVNPPETAPSQQSHLIWAQALPIAADHRIQIQPASTPLNAEHGLTLSTSTTRLSITISATQLIVDPFQIRPDETALRAAELFVDYSSVIEFDDEAHIPGSVINWAGEDLTQRAAVPVSNQVALRQYQPDVRHRLSTISWQKTAPYLGGAIIRYPVQPPAVIPGDIPTANQAETHIIMNSVQCFDLPNETPLALADITISLDIDSFSWKLSAIALNDASAALLMPNAQGRKELAIVINGHRWEFFVSKTAQSKSVSDDKLSKRFSVTGYSRTQYLADPYAPKRTRSIGTTTAVQAATDELLGTGFTLDWNTGLLPDWTMPNAAFSYQSLTPLAVIKRLSSSAGGVVVPNMATDSISVRPRFKVEPWNLLAADMDATIHESQILNEQHTDEPGVLYNQVFVSGENEGVSATIPRQYTAGDSPAPDVTDNWITAIECNTSRGKTELGQSGDRVSHSLELPVPEGATQPGLLEPGMTVAVQHTDSSRDYRAYVTAISIIVPGRSNAKVRQTVTLDQPAGWEAA
ncbi:MAG: hypothetical protein CMI09_11680 [Oceanospirillaceae bacterium]|nr:hypothetical protein [Oceanospirillaceae bacterium]